MPVNTSLSSRLSVIAQQVGLSLDIIERCVEVELVQLPIHEPELVDLRRLQALGVNLAGIEIILRMRRQILDLHAEMEVMAAEMEADQSRFEQELREMARRSSQEL